MLLLGRLLIPSRDLLVVANSGLTMVFHREVELRKCDALIGGVEHPLHCERKVARHAATIAIHVYEIKLSDLMTT